MSIQAYLQRKVEHVDRHLGDYVNRIAAPSRLIESIRYSLLSSGKRIRPILLLATIQALGKEEEDGLPFACAVEMIHTYSLVHDDLPCMDDDDYRRGRPTSHKVFGEAMAVLTGDALLTEAFGLIAEGARKLALPADIVLTMIQEGVQRTGANGMIGGQVSDMEAENKAYTLEDLEYIHEHKTCDLIIYSVRMGAYIGGASSVTLHALTQYAYALGKAFQIQDDILDEIGDPTTMGKSSGRDKERKKATYPALVGLTNSTNHVNQWIKKAKEFVTNQPNLDATRLIEIADYLLSRDR